LHIFHFLGDFSDLERKSQYFGEMQQIPHFLLISPKNPEITNGEVDLAAQNVVRERPQFILIRAGPFSAKSAFLVKIAYLA